MSDTAIATKSEQSTGRTYSLGPAKELTKKAAIELEVQFKNSMGSMRQNLLALFEGKAHKVRGFATWEEYCQVELNINSSERTIANHIAAARVENVLLLAAKGEEDKKEVLQLPLTSALELNKLPKSDMSKAYDEYKALDSEKKKTPSEGRKWLTRIVGRLKPESAKLNNSSNGKDAKKTEKTPLPEGTVVVNGKVQGATYDGSEESKRHDEALANGVVLSETEAAERKAAAAEAAGSATVASPAGDITVSLAEYGTLKSIVRRFVQFYGSDGEAMNALHDEALAYLDKADGDGSDGDGS